MKCPQISIIIPVYNAEDYLHRCLNSVIEQNHVDWECILVDDGCKDHSGAICDEYAKIDSRFIVIHKKNGGVSSARNIGIEFARGEWITFVDSDDEITTEMFKDLSEYNNCDILVRSYERVGDKNTTIPKRVELDDKVFVKQDLPDFFRNHLQGPELMAPWCKLFSAEIIKYNNIRFNEKIRSGEDTLFVAEFLQYVSSIAYSSKIGYRYYLPPNQVKLGLRYKISPHSAVNYAVNYWTVFHKLNPQPIKEDETCMTQYWYMEDYCLYDAVARKDRKMWFSNSVTNTIVSMSRLSHIQRVLYYIMKNFPWPLYVAPFYMWKKIINIRSIIANHESKDINHSSSL